MDKKRQRDETLAETLLEQAKKGLPLSRDALLHMTTFLDWEALRNFCNVNDEMRKFCAANQVWKRKFVRQVSLLPPKSQLFLYITREQWIKYWDFLAESRSPSLDILFAAFVTLFDRTGQNLTLRNSEKTFAFYLDISFGNRQDVVQHLIHRGFIAPVSIEVEEHLNFLVPVVAYCAPIRIIEGRNYMIQQDEYEIKRIMRGFWIWEWKIDFDEIGHMVIDMGRHPLDAVHVIYKFIGFGYLPVNFNFKTVTSSIEPICAHCTSPAPLTVCGACEAVPYCGQQCANAHWEKHKCTK